MFFFYAWVLRVPPSVMVDDLMRDLGVGAAVLGHLSAVYFYGYAGMQLPVGVLLDRFGPRRLMTVAGLVCAGGCVLFATGGTLPAVTGRSLPHRRLGGREPRRDHGGPAAPGRRGIGLADDQPAAGRRRPGLFVGWGAGAPFVGWLSDRIGRRKAPLVAGLALQTLALATLVWVPHLPLLGLAGLSALAGFLGSAQIVCFALIRENHPARLSATATAIGFVNGMVTGAGALFQPLVGLLLDLAWIGETALGARVDAPGAYRLAIAVRRNRVAGRVTTPKSGKMRRGDMSAQLAAALRHLLTARKAEALKKGWGGVPETIFCTEDGTPLDGDNLRHRVFYRLLGKAGLRRVRFHDLRHTYASFLIQNGRSWPTSGISLGMRRSS